MGILLWIFFGGIVGWVASIIMGTDNQQGIILNVVIGIIGAVLGGWIMSSLGQPTVNGFDLYSFMVAIVGSVILITIIGALRRT